MKFSIIIVLFLLSAVAQAQDQSPTRFSWTETTEVPPENIWQIWTDVEHWQDWDTGLKKAEIKAAGPGLGVKGILIPDQGPKAKFEFVAWELGKSYAFSTNLPFAKLVVERELGSQGELTTFTHNVYFTGLLRKFWAKRLGSRYQEILPEVLNKIKQIAEAQSAQGMSSR